MLSCDSFCKNLRLTCSLKLYHFYPVSFLPCTILNCRFEIHKIFFKNVSLKDEAALTLDDIKFISQLFAIAFLFSTRVVCNKYSKQEGREVYVFVCMCVCMCGEEDDVKYQHITLPPCITKYMAHAATIF